MIERIYYYLRKFITKKEEQDQISGGLWPRLVREASAKILKQTSSKIVELGCGEGLFLELLAKNNPEAEIYGVDIWEAILNEAKIRLRNFPNIRLIYSDAKFTNLENNFFDYCFCLNTILNLKSGIESIKLLFLEVKRILKPCGIFVFDIRNSLNPIIELQYKFVKLYDKSISIPLNSYGITKIENLVKKSGFKIKDKKFIGFPKNKFAPIVYFIVEKI